MAYFFPHMKSIMLWLTKRKMIGPKKKVKDYSAVRNLKLSSLPLSVLMSFYVFHTAGLLKKYETLSKSSMKVISR